jgi:ABC-type phosphate transport system ATPase subunit
MYVDPSTRAGHLVEFGLTKQVFEDPHAESTRQYVRGEFS